MNREIKFRVWDKVSNSYSCLNMIDALLWLQNGEFFYSAEEYSYNFKKNIVIQQFTGLKDKNEKDIYEGDIIKITDHKFSSRPSPTIQEVKWDNEYGFGIGGGLIESREILGNIFENPELCPKPE